MPIRIDFGAHEVSLRARATRAQLLAQNIINADTPGFKAKDVDFKSVFNDKIQSGLTRTHPTHVSGDNSPSVISHIKYRTPNQPSIDGNTVDSDEEKARYSENMQRFFASINFIEGRVNSLRKAIKGE